MKQSITILCIIVLVISGCNRVVRNKTEIIEKQDTIIVKKINTLNKTCQTNLYSKSYSYYWLVEKDTLDLIINVIEYKKDSTICFSVFHKKPKLFADVLKETTDCLPLIEEDFEVKRLKSINFEAPIFYLDLAKKISSEYEIEYGRKNIGYKEFNQFLLTSSLTSQLNDFIKPLNKKVERYGFEKFFLIDKSDYKSYIPNVDFTEYPEFIFNAHSGIFVQLKQLTN